MKYGLVVFIKGIIIDDDFHGERCNIHPNEWVQYIFYLQFVAQSCKDQDEIKTSLVTN
jgi:hypothetical protein